MNQLLYSLLEIAMALKVLRECEAKFIGGVRLVHKDDFMDFAVTSLISLLVLT